MDTPSDPDLRHLTNLLDFLPGPEDRDFWARLDGKGYAPTSDDHVDYVINKLVGHLFVLRDSEPNPGGIVYLVQYLLMFFGGDHPGIHRLISRRLLQIDLPAGMLGQFWVEDLRATCWRLYVRYSADGSWARKWPSDIEAWRSES